MDRRATGTPSRTSSHVTISSTFGQTARLLFPLESLEAVELETHPSSSDIFELPAASFREHTSVVATASALPEEARLLDSLAFSAPLTPPTTTTVSPA